MTKHTPAPWNEVYRHSSPDYHIIVGADGNKIAEVYGKTNYNAYLIASAPELLEALKHPLINKALSYWVANAKLFDADEFNQFDEIRTQAIAKAEGRA